MSISLQQELDEPHTTLGKRYTLLLICIIIGSIFFLFIQDEYPSAFPMGSMQLLIVELIILFIFSIDFALRISIASLKDIKSIAHLIADGLAIIPSLIIVLYYLGIMDSSELNVLSLMRLFRLLRVVKLLRVSHVLTDVFGASVLTLIFDTMTVHLGIRVFAIELGNLLHFDIFSLFDTTTLMIAVTAVGSVFGIALAITFGIVKRKQIEITEQHRSAMDAMNAFERDLENLGLMNDNIDIVTWRHHVDQFLNEEISYPEMKQETNELVAHIRHAIIDRPSLDVPFHNNLVQRLSAFFTKTQITFHPAFYSWLNRIANLYFLLIMVAAPGLTGVVVQILVIYVFNGLVVVIDDMDHAVDMEVIIFNSKILPI